MTEQPYKLQPPGAGLPKMEQAFIKYLLVPFAKYALGWKSARIWLNHEMKIITKILASLTPEQYQQRILIDHHLGIEDDTRDWSAAMVIEHLIIVNTGIIEVIKTLGREEEVDGEIRIEDVKPHQGNCSLSELQTLLDTYTRTYTPPKRNSRATKAHPWFVEFNDQEWYTFLAIHTWVHRRQIQAISARLNAP